MSNWTGMESNDKVMHDYAVWRMGFCMGLGKTLRTKYHCLETPDRKSVV